MNKEKNRYYWIDILKIVACFCVLVNHTALFLLDYAGYSNYTTLFYSINFTMSKIGVPIFIMVTGYLLLKKENTYKSILKRIVRILIPLILLSVFLYVKNLEFKEFNFFQFIVYFLSNPLAPALWYLYMLIGLYVVTPFIKKMINNFTHKDYRIFIVLFLLLPGILPVIGNIFSFSFNDNFSLAIFSSVIAFYISGIYLSEIKLNKKNFIISIIVYLISSIIMILSMYIPYLKRGEISYVFDSWNNFFTIVSSLSIFYIIRYLFEKRTINNIVSKIVSEISKLTFGIYLTHFLVNNRIYNFYFIQYIFSFNSYLGIIILYIVCFIFCGLIIYILRKIPFINKFL